MRANDESGVLTFFGKAREPLSSLSRDGKSALSRVKKNVLRNIIHNTRACAHIVCVWYLYRMISQTPECPLRYVVCWRRQRNEMMDWIVLFSKVRCFVSQNKIKLDTDVAGEIYVISVYMTQSYQHLLESVFAFCICCGWSTIPLMFGSRLMFKPLVWLYVTCPLTFKGKQNWKTEKRTCCASNPNTYSSFVLLLHTTPCKAFLC
jgi:hypothetical protein